MAAEIEFLRRNSKPSKTERIKNEDIRKSMNIERNI